MILYHYTSGQGAHGILKSKALHCSNANFMNDPSETSYFFELLAETFEKSQIAKTIHESLFNASYMRAVVDPSERFILSFSKNPDSLAMWNYYAQGNGYNLGLDIDQIVASVDDQFITVQKIELVYERSKQLEEIAKFFFLCQEGFETFLSLGRELDNAENDEHEFRELDYKRDNIIEDYNNGIFNLQLRFKHEAYKQEEEVRLVLTEDFIQDTTGFRLTNNGVFVQYLPLKLDLTRSLKSMTVHPLGTQLHLEGAKRLLASIGAIQGVHLSVSKIPFRVV